MNILTNSIFQTLFLTLLLAYIPYLFKPKTHFFRIFICIGPLLIFSLIFKNFYLNEYKQVLNLFSFMKGLEFKFKLDTFGRNFALMVAFLWFFTSIYALGYLEAKNDEKQKRFFCFFSIAVFSTLGAAFSANLFTLYCFYEFLSLSTIPLVMHKGDKLALNGGKKYISYLLGTSILFALPALIISFSEASNLNFGNSGIFSSNTPNSLLVLVALLSFFGYAKAAIFPFHSWLPGAMVAPTPVSAMLHAVAVVKLGIFTQYRVVTEVIGIERFRELTLFNFNLASIFCAIISGTIIYASLIAIKSDNFKRRLAFSTISKLNYMLLGMYLLIPLGLYASSLELYTHALSKIVLFFVAGAVYVNLGLTKISDLKGIAYKMPITIACFFLSALSICGLPPGVGFFAKLALIKAILINTSIFPLIAILISAILSSFYLLDIVLKAISRGDEANLELEIKEAPLLCITPIITLTLFGLFLFIYPSFLFNFIEFFK